ncbi:MAG: hypothetical protein E7270_09100 [Lachnospiraceae bacterium]|nr:hypothetical protein [Lachnospiraceae bacterium]
MRKRIFLVAMATVLAMGITACGDSKDNNETSKTTQEEAKDNDSVSLEEDNEESDKDSDDKLVMYYNGGEEIELYEYGSIPMKYYGPDFGYTEKSGYNVFNIKGNQVLCAMSTSILSSREELKNKSLDELKVEMLKEFNQVLGDEFGVTTNTIINDPTEAWSWHDKQVEEVVVINGRECMKFSGIVSATHLTYGTERAAYVTGYYFNIKYTPADGSESYTMPATFIGGYITNGDTTTVSITEEQKADVQHNVDVMMENMSLIDWDSSCKYE